MNYDVRRCTENAREQKCLQNIWGITLKEISDFELLDVEGGIILKQSVKKWYWFLLLRLRNSGEIL